METTRVIDIHYCITLQDFSFIFVPLCQINRLDKGFLSSRGRLSEHKYCLRTHKWLFPGQLDPTVSRSCELSEEHVSDNWPNAEMFSCFR